MKPKSPLTPDQQAEVDRINAGMDNISELIQAELQKLSPDNKVKYLLIVDPHDSTGMISNTACPHCLLNMMGEMAQRVLAGEGQEVAPHSGAVH